MHGMKWSNGWFLSAVGVLLLALAPLSAQAQTEEQMQMITEMQELQSRINSIQERAVEANPSIVEAAQDIENKMIEKMEAAGHRPLDDLAALEAAEARLQDPSLSDSDREAIVSSSEVQNAQRNLMAAQQAVSEDAEMISMQQAFEEDLLDKMKAIDPQVESYFERGVALQQQLSAQMQQR